MAIWEIVSLVVYGATILLGLPSNILALYIFYCRARVRLTPNLIYMINLCLSDLVFILFLPLKMLEKGKMDWTMPGFLCPLYNLIHFGTIYTSAGFLTAVSAGRFLGAVYPIHYQVYKKPFYSSWFLWGSGAWWDSTAFSSLLSRPPGTPNPAFSLVTALPATTTSLKTSWLYWPLCGWNSLWSCSFSPC